MPADYIQITTTGNFRAQRLSRFLRLLRETKEAGDEIKDIMDHMVADPIYAGLEGSSGVGVPVLQGQAAYNLVAGAYARVNHADVDAAIDRMGE